MVSESGLHRDIAVVCSDHVYRIRQLHQPGVAAAFCAECGGEYPCRTIQILNRRPDNLKVG